VLTTGYSAPTIFLDDAVGVAVMLSGSPVSSVTPIEQFSQAVYQRSCNAMSDQLCEAMF
jgi:hypothetical protein